MFGIASSSIANAVRSQLGMCDKAANLSQFAALNSSDSTVYLSL